MTVLVGGAVASINTIGAMSGAIAGATAGLGIGTLGSAVGTGTASGVAGASAASAATGAILGSVCGVGMTGATAGATAGAITGAISNMGTTLLTSVVTLGAISGPIGGVVLGTAQSQTSATYTFDCWKAVVHDESSEPSNGRLLRDVIMDPCIKQVTTTQIGESILPELILQNIWNEQFRIKYTLLPSNELSAHAVKI